MNRALKFRQRLVSTGVVVLAILLLAFYAALRSESQTETMNLWVEHTQTVLDVISQTRLQRARLQNEVWTYRATRRADLPDRFQADLVNLRQQLPELTSLTKDNAAQQKILAELVPLVNKQAQVLQDDMEQEVKEAHAATSALPDLSLSTTSGDSLRMLFDKLDSNERALLKTRIGNVKAIVRRTRIVLLTTGVLVLLIIFTAGYLVQSEITMRANIESGLRRARELLGGKYEEKSVALGHAMEDLHTHLEARKQAESEILKLNNELEGRVQERTAELREINRELEAFTYSVSHDLRAPLRHMEGFSRILQQEHGTQLSAEAQHYLKRIRDAATHMSALVEDLLRLSRIGRQVPHLELTLLGRVAEEARQEAVESAAEREIQWRCAPLPKVEVDAVLIRQVFANLYSNAVKFTRGKLPAIIETGWCDNGGECQIFVRDNGAGFDPQFADKLFGVFQRLHRQDEFEGTGIGLASIQRIIHKHGGRVWAESKPGEGATFYFTLPLEVKNELRQHEAIGVSA